jgi:hypothetical protein
MLPNGLSILISSNNFPLLDNLHKPHDVPLETHLHILDLNYLDAPESESEPFTLKVTTDKLKTEIDRDQFNLYAISIYENKNGKYRILAANYLSEKDVFSIEKFRYDDKNNKLIHMDRFTKGLKYGQLCDIVAIDDDLFYFTKCFAHTFFKNLKLNLEMKNGEIWAYNLKQNIVYQVVKNIFMPKSIAYIKSNDLIVVSNFEEQGLTIFKKENDNGLTKLQDIQLNTFVFNIFVDISTHLWIVSHPVPHQTFNLNNSIDSFTTSELISLEFDFRNLKIKNFKKKLYFSSNGTNYRINALSGAFFYKKNYILFSLMNDPLVCNIV